MTRIRFVVYQNRGYSDEMDLLIVCSDCDRTSDIPSDYVEIHPQDEVYDLADECEYCGCDRYQEAKHSTSRRLKVKFVMYQEENWGEDGEIDEDVTGNYIILCTNCEHTSSVPGAFERVDPSDEIFDMAKGPGVRCDECGCGPNKDAEHFPGGRYSDECDKWHGKKKKVGIFPGDEEFLDEFDN